MNYKLYPPIKKTVWGPVNSQKDLEYAIAKSGQGFGVDLSGPACNFNKAYPCDQTLYQFKGWGLHKGIDIPVATHTEIYSCTNGKVVEVSDDVTQGIGLVIYDNIQKCKLVYWHLESHVIKLGDIVKAQDMIAYSDNTGFSAGPHVHVQLNQTDDTGGSLNAVDPMPYFVWDDMLDKEDIRFLQALEGYHDPAGVDFWGDGTHTLKEYKVARVPDKIKELQSI